MEFDLDSGVAILERTPAVLRELLAGLPEAWIVPNEGPETWSPLDVIGHLIHGEETDWMVRTRIILSPGPERRFEPFDRLGHVGAEHGSTMEALLDRFARLRAANLEELRGLDLRGEQLSRTGEHPEFGTVTLAQLLATWVVHDLGHLAQIARVMAKQYHVEVGPWEAYLSILRR